MTTPAVHVHDVSKLFHRGERHDSLRDLIPATVRRLRGVKAPSAAQELTQDAFWAVHDVTFDVQFGRALGIIGPNGAGKSTMLKLLTGILRPTHGEIRMRGRVASLIEVSAGFHQDLTGRENVYLQGAILGMSRRDVASRLASIVEFSGIEAFIDTPVKRYSSGMNARLGFSIAVHLDPDVLVIDEVLSVGDMAFQQKCVERMLAFKRDGVAIVFVSHNMQAIGQLCDEALVLKGTPRFRGAVGQAVEAYLALSGVGEGTAHGDGIVVEQTTLTNADGVEVDAVDPGTPLALDARYRITRPLGPLVWAMRVHRATDGMIVGDASFTSEELGVGRLAPGDEVRIRFGHVCNLSRGQYAYEVNVYDPSQGRHRLGYRAAAVLRVDETRSIGGIADLAVDVAADVAPASVLVSV